MAVSLELLNSTTRVNNKGWNISLFLDSHNQLVPLTCNLCDNICCNPSILNCTEHDDQKDIDDKIYCFSCLSDTIKNNNNQCTSGHSNPNIKQVKQIKMIIQSKTVHCPFSVHYLCSNDTQSDNIQQVMDTEGADQQKNQCVWQGPLKQLVTQHLPNCILNNNPTLMLKWENSGLRNKVKALENTLQVQKEIYENKLLQMTVQLKKLQEINSQFECKLESKSEEKYDFKETAICEKSTYTICTENGEYLCINSNGWCFQSAQSEMAAVFQFIPWCKSRELYYMKHLSIKESNNHWLSFKKVNVGVWEKKSSAAIWKLIPVPETVLKFKIECIYENEVKGYLGLDASKKQIQLCPESKALVYRLELKFYENVIKEDVIYAIHCYRALGDESYLSYSSVSGICTREHKIQNSKFKFVKQENMWCIQNVYDDKRLGHWMSFMKMVNPVAIGLTVIGANKIYYPIALYGTQSDRAQWELMPLHHHEMCFKIICYYKGQKQNVGIDVDGSTMVTINLEQFIWKLEPVR